MKFTEYFLRNRSRPDRRHIRDDWIQGVIDQPERKQTQKDGRIRMWGRVDDFGGRYLRVVMLEDEETVHNAFFDRRFQGTNDET